MEDLKVLSEDPEPPGSGSSQTTVATLANEKTPTARRRIRPPRSMPSPAESLEALLPVDTFPSSPASLRRGPATTTDVTKSFRRRCYPLVGNADWNDWIWQLRNRITDFATLESMFELSDEERGVLKLDACGLPVAITPYYASLMSACDPGHPLRRTMIPTVHELKVRPEECEDPLGEDDTSPVPGLVHRYPDRVLFLATGTCAAYCRYCTRSRSVGCDQGIAPSKTRWQEAIDYIARTPRVRDVVVSGGDPLTMSDDSLEWLLSRLRAIPHLEIIRIGSKVPVVLPQRITPALVRMLKRYHPLWMSLHFTHPQELTPECGKACGLLADAGIPLGSQTVLLSQVNDNVGTMTELMRGLMRFRVRPYYIYQCDPVAGSGHFRTPVETGLEIIRGLRGFTSGYAVPSYVIDAPGGGGKIPLLPNYVESVDDKALHLRNYAGGIYHYPRTVSEG